MRAYARFGGHTFHESPGTLYLVSTCFEQGQLLRQISNQLQPTVTDLSLTLVLQLMSGTVTNKEEENVLGIVPFIAKHCEYSGKSKFHSRPSKTNLRLTQLQQLFHMVQILANFA